MHRPFEVGGDAALYFDPLSVEAIEEAIEKIIFDVDLQKTMSEKSLIQSNGFMGQNCSTNRRSLCQGSWFVDENNTENSCHNKNETLSDQSRIGSTI